MQLTHIPKLEPQQIGVWNVSGWYLAKHELYPSKDVIVYQCQFGHGATIPPECGIGRDGISDHIFRCHCLKFEQRIKLDGWPEWFYKIAGQEFVTKLYNLTKK